MIWLRTAEGGDIGGSLRGSAGDGAVRDAVRQQLQIDFGEGLVEIRGSKVRAYLFVATLGYALAGA